MMDIDLLTCDYTEITSQIFHLRQNLAKNSQLIDYVGTECIEYFLV